MHEWLLFQLYGPMQSWGSEAVGEVRPSGLHPSRSAVLGLLAAALGIDRHDEAAHERMSEAYGLAVRVDSAGSPLRDYHSVQVPRKRGKRRFFTRRDELVMQLGSDESPETLLSKRDYVLDAFFTICLGRLGASPPHSLEELRRALLAPRFVTWLGRKSCPAALPFRPRVVEAATVAEALAEYAPDHMVLHRVRRERSEIVDLFWEPGLDAGVEPKETYERRDLTGNRSQWLFSRRCEHRGDVSLPPAAELGGQEDQSEQGGWSCT